MADNFFEGLEDMVKGIFNFDPQNDPNIRMMAARAEIADLKKQEMEVYAAIGKKAVAMYGEDKFEELAERLKLIQMNLTAAKNKMKRMQEENKMQETEEGSRSKNICSCCGSENPEGMRFCQNCGAELEEAEEPDQFCIHCGEKLPDKANFCGKCGTKVERGDKMPEQSSK